MSRALLPTFEVLERVHPSISAKLGHYAGVGAALFNSGSRQQLVENHQRLADYPLGSAHTRRAFAAYFEMFAEAPSLPRWSEQKTRRFVTTDESFRELIANTNGPIIVAMTHGGNWDAAGAYANFELLPVVTVAEVLKPPELYDYFVSSREALGMKIFPAKHGVFNELRDYVQGKHVLVPLLADRDISGVGIEVDFGGSRALVAAGPAALANQLGASLVALHMSRVHGGVAKYHLNTRQVEITGDVEADTQAWVSAVVPLIQSNLADWHMMQPLFVEDLDQERLARARERHLREGNA